MDERGLLRRGCHGPVTTSATRAGAATTRLVPTALISGPNRVLTVPTATDALDKIRLATV